MGRAVPGEVPVMQSLLHYVQNPAFVSFLLSSTVYGALTTFLLARLRAHDDKTLLALKANFDKQLVAVREELARETARHSWLYEERARAMVEIYAALIAADDAFDDFAHSWGQLPGDARGPKDKWLSARDAGEAFLQAYRPKQLIFPVAVVDALARANRRFITIFNAYHRHLAMEEGDEQAALTKLMTEENLSFNAPEDAVEVVKREFRSLYGSNDA
jgi:hypothetical protein